VKRLSSLACLVSLSMFVAPAAHADCGFNSPARAKGLKTSLVRAYAPCGGGYTFAAPNTATSSGVPACGPPAPINDADPPSCVHAPCSYTSTAYTFDEDDGRCRVRIRQYVTSLCGVGPGEPAECLSLRAKVVCQGIRDADGKPAHSSGGFLLIVTVRFTTNDGTPTTVVDAPLQRPFKVAGGKISDEIEMWGTFFGSWLSTCTQVQILDIDLLDDAGLRFASMGSSTR